LFSALRCDGAEVHSELAFDLGCGHLFKITKRAVARIVDHDVDAAEPLDHLIDGRFRSCFVGNVQLDKGVTPPSLHPLLPTAGTRAPTGRLVAAIPENNFNSTF